MLDVACFFFFKRFFVPVNCTSSWHAVMLFCTSLLCIIYDPAQTSKQRNCLYLFFEAYPQAIILHMHSLSVSGMKNMFLLSWKYYFNIPQDSSI